MLKRESFEVTDAGGDITEGNCINGIYYTFDTEKKTAEVIKGEKEYAGSIVIPKTVNYNGDIYDVTSVGGAAFSGCRGVTSVTIPESVTSIGWTAFAETSMTSVTIPSSVTSIGAYAFTSSNLTSVTIPKSVTFIGEGAWGGCHQLTSIQLESGNPVYDARDNCNAIIETASNTLIEGWAFSSIPNSVTSLGNAAFVYCNDMVPIEIPNSVTSIGTEAFWGCGLTSITIPANVKNIGNYAFYCSSLTNMYCYAKDLPGTDGEIFLEVDLKNATLHVPAASLEAYKTTVPWKNFGHIVALPDELTDIESIAIADGCTYQIFTLDGKSIETLQKGVNIIHFSNGTVKSVYVK